MLLRWTRVGWNSTAVISASFGSVSVCGPLPHGSPAVLFVNRRHSGFWDFSSTVPIDVVRVKCYVNCLFSLACVELRTTINFTLFRSGRFPVLWACSEAAHVCILANRIPLLFLDSLLHRSASTADVNLPTLTENLVDYAILFQLARRHP